MSQNFFTDNDDLRWYVEHGIDWEPLVRLTEYDYRAEDGFKTAAEALVVYREILELVGEFVAREIAPHAAEIDREGVELVDGEAVFPPRLQRIFEQIRELGLHGLPVPRELGGQNAPLLLYFLSGELMARADVSTMAHHSFHAGIAMAMLVFSLREGTTRVDRERARLLETRFGREIGEIARGEAWGSMDITEPDAGSDMAQLRAVGEQDADGRWTVTGRKIFITSGHGKYHFVIARTEAAADPDDPFAGLSGLSMFLVPAWEEDADGGRRRHVRIERLEPKLGHHGSATASLLFERAPAQLIGKRGEGFKYMLILMNNARIGVGFEALGLCEAARRLAAAYAAERRSMGKTLDRHELIADYLDEMESDIQGIRALAVASGCHEELAQKTRVFGELLGGQDAAATEREAARHAARSRRLTPLLKYLAAEKAVEMARRCVQIHGGNGYIREYPAERLLRDAVVFPIYEGTSQIQALMATKDTLTGILRNPQRFVRRLARARWRSLSARDAAERQLARIQSCSLAAQQHLILRTAGGKLRQLPAKPLADWPRTLLRDWNPKRDFALALLHAERLTRILVDEAVCEILHAQIRKDPARREVFARYAERAEPRCRALLDEITHTGARLLAGLEAAEADAPEASEPGGPEASEPDGGRAAR